MSSPARTRRSTVLTETVNGLTPVLLLFSVFLTLRGHNAPGGGFAGGLVMGSAVVLRYLAAGTRGLRTLRIDPIVLIGLGLLIAAGVGLTSLVVDGSFHRSGKTYDLRYDDELYSLQQVFGPQLERKEDGEWLVAPF